MNKALQLLFKDYLHVMSGFWKHDMTLAFPFNVVFRIE